MALGLAIAVKFLPIVVLPLYWKRVRIRDAALAAAVVGLLYVPFLIMAGFRSARLATMCKSFRFNGPVFAVLDRVAPPQVLVVLAVLVGLATASWLRIKTGAPEFSPHQFAWPMAACSFVRTCGVPLVSAMAASVSNFVLDAADHRLDGEHYPHICHVALARTWTPGGRFPVG